MNAVQRWFQSGSRETPKRAIELDSATVDRLRRHFAYDYVDGEALAAIARESRDAGIGEVSLERPETQRREIRIARRSMAKRVKPWPACYHDHDHWGILVGRWFFSLSIDPTGDMRTAGGNRIRCRPRWRSTMLLVEPDQVFAPCVGHTDLGSLLVCDVLDHVVARFGAADGPHGAYWNSVDVLRAGVAALCDSPEESLGNEEWDRIRVLEPQIRAGIFAAVIEPVVYDASHFATEHDTSGDNERLVSEASIRAHLPAYIDHESAVYGPKTTCITM